MLLVFHLPFSFILQNVCPVHRWYEVWMLASNGIQAIQALRLNKGERKKCQELHYANMLFACCQSQRLFHQHKQSYAHCTRSIPTFAKQFYFNCFSPNSVGCHFLLSLMSSHDVAKLHISQYFDRLTFSVPVSHDRLSEKSREFRENVFFEMFFVRAKKPTEKEKSNVLWFFFAVVMLHPICLT